MSLLPRLARTVRLASGLLFAAFVLGGCAAVVAQNPSSALKPVNAVTDSGADRVMLKGHDVVAYFTEGRHRLGSPQFSSVHEGVSFRFASAEHKALFDQAPAKYLPEFGGFCATGIAYAIPWGGNADTFAFIDGKLYIFGGQRSKDAFLLDVPGNRQLAEKYWAEEVVGNNSFFQRSKRLVLRVPHYKSDDELARLVAQSKGKAP